MRAKLGIPLDAMFYKLTLEAPLGWQGYTFELVGTLAEPTDPPEAPRFTDIFVEHNQLTIIAWRRRVSCEGTPIFLEALWHPTTGETLALKGLEKDALQDNVKRVHRGLKLLKAIDARGRRLGSRAMSEAAFRQRYPEAYQQGAEAYTSRPKRYEIADALGLNYKTFNSYLKEYNLSFPPF